MGSAPRSMDAAAACCCCHLLANASQKPGPRASAAACGAGCAARGLRERGGVRGWPGGPGEAKGQEAESGDLSWSQWGPGEVEGWGGGGRWGRGDPGDWEEVRAWRREEYSEALG